MKSGLVVAVGLLVLYLAATGKLPRIPAAWRTLNGTADKGAALDLPTSGGPLPPAITQPQDIAGILAGRAVVHG